MSKLRAIVYGNVIIMRNSAGTLVVQLKRYKGWVRVTSIPVYTLRFRIIDLAIHHNI